MDAIYQALTDGSIGPVAKAARTVIVYLFLLIGLRLAGKRELGQLSTFDLVLLLILSSAIETTIQGDDNSITGGLLAAAILLAINRLFAFFSFHHARVKRVVEGMPVVLIEDGKVCEENLRAELIDEDEVRRFCLQQGYESFDEIAHAEMDISGDVSIVPRHPTEDERRFDAVLTRLDRIEQLLQQQGATREREVTG
jgi:uncharacterized membrane protein YcaP (DUF421 family)